MVLPPSGMVYALEQRIHVDTPDEGQARVCGGRDTAAALLLPLRHRICGLCKEEKDEQKIIKMFPLIY